MDISITPSHSALWFGVKPIEFVTLVALFVGPALAVLITLWGEHIRRERERKETVLHTLLRSRLTPADALFSMTITLVPLNFRGDQAVETTHRAYMEATRYPAPPGGKEEYQKQATIKLDKMIVAMMRNIGVKVSELDVSNNLYASDSFVERDKLVETSLKATVEIAEQMKRSADATIAALEQSRNA